MKTDGTLTVHEARADALEPSIQEYLAEMKDRYGETRPKTLHDILNATGAQTRPLSTTMAPFVSWLSRRFTRLLRPGFTQTEYPVLPRFGLVSKSLAEEATRLSRTTDAPARFYEVVEASSATLPDVLFSKRGVKRRQREHGDTEVVSDVIPCYRSLGACCLQEDALEDDLTPEDLFGSDVDDDD